MNLSKGTAVTDVTAEDAPTLADYYHPVAEAKDVTSEPRRFHLLNTEVVLFRDSAGAPVAFKDLCIHRGTPLSLGTVIGDRIVCAYHGWEYDRTGACVRIPSLTSDQPIPSRARAISYHAEERYGLVWVSINDPVAPVPDFPNGEYDDPGYHAHLSSHNVFKTSAGRAVENFMDWSHFPFVHPGLLAPADRTLVPPTDIKETEYGLTYSYETVEPESPTSSGAESVLYEYYYYLPFTIHIRISHKEGGVSYCSFFASPSSQKTTDAYTMFVRNFALDTPDSDFDYFANRVTEQDRRIIESQRPEEIPLDWREELHIRVPDAPTIAFRRALSKIKDIADYADM
jgi:phenylpropionate dioxygenase-like ring-hydroxylating dioxygenase large terminal subunit